MHPVNDLDRVLGYCSNPNLFLMDGADGVAKADAVGLHLGPCGETTKTHAAIAELVRWRDAYPAFGVSEVDTGPPELLQTPRVIGIPKSASGTHNSAP